jgi:hypothetical protein
MYHLPIDIFIFNPYLIDILTSIYPTNIFEITLPTLTTLFSWCCPFLHSIRRLFFSTWGWKLIYLKAVTTRNYVICNHHVCNWDATTGHMQLCKVFYAITMDFCPLFGGVCNYGVIMITFIPTFGWFLCILLYKFDMYTHSCMCNQNRPIMVFGKLGTHFL